MLTPRRRCSGDGGLPQPGVCCSGFEKIVHSTKSQELRETNVLENEKRRYLFSLFCEFATSGQVFPRSFQLSGIQCTSEIAYRESGLAIVYKGIHRGSDQAVAIKAIKKLDIEILRVSPPIDLGFQRNNSTNSVRSRKSHCGRTFHTPIS